MTAKEFNERTRFNYMGYALGIREWLQPTLEDMFYSSFDLTLVENLEEMSDNLERDYNLKRIDRDEVNNVKGKVIAFKLAPGVDFHFVVRKGRNWYHKRGQDPYFMRLAKKFVMGEEWRFDHANYNSKTVFFKVL